MPVCADTSVYVSKCESFHLLPNSLLLAIRRPRGILCCHFSEDRPGEGSMQALKENLEVSGREF